MATDSDPARIWLKVSVSQKPANKTASDCSLSKVDLSIIEPYSLGQLFIDIAPRLMEDVVWIGIGLVLVSFSVGPLKLPQDKLQ